MGATIAFGVVCDDRFDLPWYEYDDVEDWWMDFDNHTPTHPDEYYTNVKDWLEKHPLIVDEETLGDYDDCFCAIILPNTRLRCFTGDTEAFNPSDLSVSPEDKENLYNFLWEHRIEYKEEPDWLLMSDF